MIPVAAQERYLGVFLETTISYTCVAFNSKKPDCIHKHAYTKAF